MKKLVFLPLLLLTVFACASNLISQYSEFFPPTPAPDFTVTTSDGQVKKLYQDYINQQKLVVIEAFFTTCPPCAAHAPLVQSLYTSMQAAHPGKVEFILLSTLSTDTNVKVAQYKTSKGLTMPGVGKDGGSITALQPYLNGQYGPFQGTPTFIVIAPGTGAVVFDIRGATPSQTIALLQQKIESFFPKISSLTNPFEAPLDNVTITVDGPGFDTSLIVDGTYSLSQIAPLQNATYTLTPHKTGVTTGVTTYDLVLISKHILGLEPFKCPWQIVAADVNCTGSITTFDIVTARQVILGILDSFPCGSWRFMPDSAVLSNGNSQNFVGVKLGDVNAGPCTDSLLADAEGRSQLQKIYFQPHHFQPGETARISVFFKDDIELEGLQFAFDLDPELLIINTLESQSLEGFDNGCFRRSERNFALSWLHAQGQQIEANSPLLTFEITAPLGGDLSELLHFSPSGLIPEAYDSEGKIHPIQLAAFASYPKYTIAPNPTQGPFSLQTYSDHEGDLLVQMLDIQGNMVFEKRVFAAQGPNSWELEVPSLAAGLYFLKVNGVAAEAITLSRGQ